jgi:ribosomal protein S27E
MYNQSSNIDVVYIVAGFLSLILIITFFVMAFRLKKIMEYLSKMAGIALLKTKRENIIELWCPDCQNKHFYFTDDSHPIKCACGNDITEHLDKKIAELNSKRQTDKTDTK